MTIPIPPLRTPPDSGWEHYDVWERVNTVFYSIPNYFETELVIRGINVTDIFASKIRKPPDTNCHPYPSSKKGASDEAEDDKGDNFGRIARSETLDEYITSISR